MRKCTGVPHNSFCFASWPNMARFVLQEDIEQILKEVSLNFPLMIFLFMPDNLVAHSSIKRSVSPFFLIMSVLSHQPQVCHLCCCLHRGGMYPDTSQRCTSMGCANFLWSTRTNIFIMRMGRHWSILPRRWCCVHSLEILRILGFQQPELNGAALSKVLD